MPGWISDLILLAPWAAVLAFLIWVGVKVGKPVRKFMHLIDDLVGEEERPGVPARPGLMERVGMIEGKQDDLQAAVRVVQHEVTTNHGSSLKDAVKDVQARLDEQTEQLNDQALQISELHTQYVKE